MDIVLNRIATRIDSLKAALIKQYKEADEKGYTEEKFSIILQYDMLELFLDIMRDEKYKYIKENLSATYGSACEMD